MSEKVEAAVEATTHPPAPSSTSSDAASVSTTVSTVPRSEVSRPTTFSKPSGLRPPTKIGRLCSNSAPKPAVPISPRSGELIFLSYFLYTFMQYTNLITIFCTQNCFTQECIYFTFTVNS